MFCDVAYLGFSAKQCAHALCSEIVPGSKEVELHNLELTEGSSIMAPTVPDTLLFSSLACSHLQAGLRAAAAGMKGTDPQFCDEHGNWSLERIARMPHGDKFVFAITNGIRNKVIRHPVRSQRPHFLSVLMDARNTAGHVQRAVTEFQILLDMHRSYKHQTRSGCDANWEAIKRAVLRTRPPCADIIDDLVFFLIKKSDGADAAYLKDGDMFASRFGGARRLPGALYVAAANLKEPNVAVACMKLAITCDKAYLFNQVCGWVQARDFSSLASAKGIKLVATAQEILEEALDKLPRAGIDKEVFEDRNLNTVYGWLGCTLATVLLPGKATPANAKVDAEVRMYRAGLEYVQKLQAHFPKMDPTYLTPPWQSMLEAARQRASAEGGCRDGVGFG